MTEFGADIQASSLQRREGEYFETSRNAARGTVVHHFRLVHCYALGVECRDDVLATPIARQELGYMSCIRVSRVNLDASSRRKVFVAPTSVGPSVGGMPRGKSSKGKEDM